MVTGFTARLVRLMNEKDSLLCVGLDPALPGQRRSQTIAREYPKRKDENQARLAFCLEMIDKTKDFCSAFKPNQQYIAGFTRKDHVELTSAIRKADAVSILDYKLNDIGDSMESALFHIGKWGYEALTLNPFLGNMEEAIAVAHKHRPEIGVIVLTLTSNPEAVVYQKEAILGGRPLYQAIAQDVRKYGADGCVVGAAGHITEEDISAVRGIIGEDKVLLVPGIGAQRGDPMKVIVAGGKNLLMNVGREIIYSDNPKRIAEKYRELFKKTR